MTILTLHVPDKKGEDLMVALDMTPVEAVCDALRNAIERSGTPLITTYFHGLSQQEQTAEIDAAIVSYLRGIQASIHNIVDGCVQTITHHARAKLADRPEGALFDPFDLPFDDDYAATFYTNRVVEADRNTHDTLPCHKREKT